MSLHLTNAMQVTVEFSDYREDRVINGGGYLLDVIIEAKQTQKSKELQN